jgi:hypothetical protein
MSGVQKYCKECMTHRKIFFKDKVMKCIFCGEILSGENK